MSNQVDVISRVLRAMAGSRVLAETEATESVQDIAHQVEHTPLPQPDDDIGVLRFNHNEPSSERHPWGHIFRISPNLVESGSLTDKLRETLDRLRTDFTPLDVLVVVFSCGKRLLDPLEVVGAVEALKHILTFFKGRLLLSCATPSALGLSEKAKDFVRAQEEQIISFVSTELGIGRDNILRSVDDVHTLLLRHMTSD